MRKALIAAICILVVSSGWPVQAQSGGPRLVGVEALDLRSHALSVPNGKLDTLRLTFDAAIDESTLHLSDFRVSGAGGNRILTGYGMPGPTIVELWFEEGGFDTGDKPTLSYTGSRLKGQGSGQNAVVSGPATVDKAAPVLVSVRATVGSDVVTARFSETLASGVQTSHFTYSDDGPGGAAGLSGTATQSGSSVALKLDVAAAAGDMDKDRLAPTSAIQDTAGNAAYVAPKAIAAPRATEARGQIGSDQVRVVFNVPVESKSGGTISNSDAFDVVYDASPVDPIEGVTAVQGAAGTYEVLVTLTSKVKASDVRSLEPARMQVLSGQLREASAGPDIPFASVPFVDKKAPQVIGAFSEDRNRNGFVDGVSLQWSEPVAAVCVDGDALEVVGYELDLQAGQTPFVSSDGLRATVPLKERVTSAPDTGHVPSFIMRACSDARLPFKDLAEPANGAILVGAGAVAEVDGANPSIVFGKTQDRDGDGYLDAYAFSFSEPMKTTSSDLSAWAIKGRNITGGQWQTATTLLVEFQESKVGDTGDRPDVDYTGDTFEDLAGNKLFKFEGGGFQKVDDAAPRVVGSYGDAGQKVLRLVFSEGVEGVTTPGSGDGGPGRGLQEGDFAYQNPGGNDGGNTGIIGVRHSRGDRVAYLDTALPLQASDFGPNGDKVLPLQGHVRESNTKSNAERLTVAPQLVSFTEKDLDPPGALSALTWTIAANQATLTFTAPADDGLAAASGNVTGYHVIVANETLPVGLTGADALKKSRWSNLILAPTPPGAVGTQQNITLRGLCPSTPYHVAVVALDEDRNPSPLAVPPSFTTVADTTAPTGAVTFLSTTYRMDGGVPEPTEILDGRIAWEGFADPEACALSYRWAVDDDPGRVIKGTDNLTILPGAELDLPTDLDLPADLYLHVAAFNDGGLNSTTHHYPLRIVQPAVCAPESATVTGLEVIHEDGFTTLTWNTFAQPLPDNVTLAGYQIWLRRGGSAPWQLFDTVDADAQAATQKYLHDEPVDRIDRYVVTAYFSDGLCKIKVDDNARATPDMDGFENTKIEIVEPPPAVPTWAWVTLMAISLLVVGGVFVFYGMRRTKLDESWLEDEEPEMDHDNPFGSDPITDLSVGEHNVEDDPFEPVSDDVPTLDIVCPACTHSFQATGHRPLNVTCPNCHANGVLE